MRALPGRRAGAAGGDAATLRPAMSEDLNTIPRRRLLAGLPLLAASGPVWPARDALVVTLRAPDSAQDVRNVFVRDAVRLALDRTVGSHGPYRMHVSAAMNKNRALIEAARNAVPNFLVVTGPGTGQAAGLAPVPFPIHLGVNRYRVCFVHAPRQALLRGVDSVQALARLHHVQGKDWADVEVLRANGQRVTEVSAYESMFRMVALGRADLFCRNVLEAGPEQRSHAGMAGLALDDSLLLSYDLPQYLYTHPGNRVLIERVAAGLRRAFADGSLQALLKRHLQPSLAALNLARRRVITLKTPDAAVTVMDDRPFQVDLVRLLSR